MFIALLSGTILFTGNILTFNGKTEQTLLIAFFLAIAGCIFMVTVSMLIHESEVWEYIGKRSLPVYVLQGFSIAMFRILLTKLHLNIGSGVFPLCFCTFFGTILPLIAYWICTKFWILDFFFYPGKYLKRK